VKHKYLLGITGLGIILALVLGLVGVFGAGAADHKDSPTAAGDPAADITDIYAFRSPANNNNVVAILNVNPLSVPGSFAYNFSPNVAYQFHVNNTGGLTDNATVTITFEPVQADHTQAFTVGGLGAPIQGRTTAPTVAKTPNAPSIVTNGPISVFIGPRDDPFFADIVGILRYLGGPFTPANGVRAAGDTPMDTFAGTNVSSIVLEMPIVAVTGAANSNTGVIKVWASTSRTPWSPNPNLLNQWNRWQSERASKKENANDWAAFRSHEVAIGAPDPGASAPTMTRIDRMAIPAVATVLIPSSMKEAYNQGAPATDVQQYRPTVQATIIALRAAVKPVLGPEDSPGVPADVLATVLSPDIVTIDFSKPVAFPNGRRLTDDVVSAALGLVLNRGNVLGGGPGISDGVPANDSAFLSTFPYEAAPHQPQ